MERLTEQLRAQARRRQEQDTLCYADGGIETDVQPQDYLEWKAADEIARLRHALAFYARQIAYEGANQRNLGQDPFTPEGQPYVQSVDRDLGAIARAALQS